MTGKEKCEILKSIRKQIADANNIVYMEPECHHEGDCLGTCPKFDAQLRYLDAEINRKIAKGEQVTVSGISIEPFEEIVQKSSYANENNTNDIKPINEDHIDVADLDISCGVMKDYETDDNE